MQSSYWVAWFPNLLLKYTVYKLEEHTAQFRCEKRLDTMQSDVQAIEMCGPEQLVSGKMCGYDPADELMNLWNSEISRAFGKPEYNQTNQTNFKAVIERFISD